MYLAYCSTLSALIIYTASDNRTVSQNSDPNNCDIFLLFLLKISD
jgi:hypothetical protein